MIRKKQGRVRKNSTHKNLKVISSLNLTGKVALVTGAATGIGEAAALKLSSLGANVICAGLPGDPLSDVVLSIKRIGRKALLFEGDLANPDTCDECVKLAVQEFGRLDILVSNAGVVLVSEEADKISDDAFLRTMASNVNATFYITRAALKPLKKSHGVIVAISSIAGIKGEPGDVVYGGSKGFVNAFMQGLAVEQAKHGIRVNIVCPGVVATAMTKASRSTISKQEEKKMTENVPMKRHGTVEEIANVIAFLASDLSSYMTGAIVPVDGAYTTSWGDVDEVPNNLKRRPKGSLDKILKHTFHGGFKKNNPEPLPRD